MGAAHPPAARFNQKHDGAGRKWRHHCLDEIRPRDRRSVEVVSSGAETHKISHRAGLGLVADGTTSRERALQFIPADDLAHVH